MGARLGALPSQCRDAWRLARDFQLPEGYARVNKIVLLGMGGSAIGSGYLSSLAETEASVPVIVRRDYQLPTFVDYETLLIASSYSGNTEEPLAALAQAMNTGAKKLALTTGGTLAEVARENGLPVFIYDYKAEPRAALGYSIMPLLAIMAGLGLIGDKSVEVTETVETLSAMVGELSEKAPAAQNPAKQMAMRLEDRLPVIYGGGFLAEVARRWKQQINETAKTWAFHEVFPELAHNAVEGYALPTEIAEKAHVIMLGSPDLGERLQAHYRLTAELLNDADVSSEYAASRGKSLLSQMMSLTLLGDYVSYYLAILNGIDPSPVAAIDYLKEQLNRSRK